MKEKLRSKRPSKNIYFLAIGVILLLAGAICFIQGQNNQSGHFGVLSEEQLIQISFEELPQGSLYITESRRAFQRGNMILLVPSIDVETPVGESTLPDVLIETPGLFEFSQLPGEVNVNVSIAGHRDIHDRVFFYLDKVTHGDLSLRCT